MVAARNGKEALRLLEDWSEERAMPKLVIADMVMPVMGGEELLSQLARDPRFRAIPKAIITASPDPERVAAVTRLGALAVLDKPLMKDPLRNLLAKLPTE
jgi:CheY-like chemotaxis protein